MRPHYHIYWKQYRLDDHLFWQRMVAENYLLRYSGAISIEYSVKSCRSVECLVREMAK